MQRGQKEGFPMDKVLILECTDKELEELKQCVVQGLFALSQELRAKLLESINDAEHS